MFEVRDAATKQLISSHPTFPQAEQALDRLAESGSGSWVVIETRTGEEAATLGREADPDIARRSTIREIAGEPQD